MNKILYNDNLNAELQNIVKNNPKNFIKCIKSKGFDERYKNRQYLVDYIMQCTSMLVDTAEFKYSLKTRLYWVLNKIQDWDDDKVKCIVDGKPLVHCNIKHINTGYKKTCCKLCERKLAQQNTEKRMMKEYGVHNAFQRKDIIDKLSKDKEKIQRKREKTRRKNKTFKTSKKEDEAYEFLCSKFSRDDIVRQFKNR